MTTGRDAYELGRLVGFAHGLESSVAAQERTGNLSAARSLSIQLANVKTQIAIVRDRIQGVEAG